MCRRTFSLSIFGAFPGMLQGNRTITSSIGARAKSGKALVLFCENEHCAEAGDHSRRAMIRLHEVAHEVYSGE